jgi:2-succinyl-6-hydroxy-2,4-cyclohexadiene-1-carboxylate synthase
MGKLDEFDTVINLLNDEFSYLTVDLPGHGKTEVLGGDEYYTMENTAQALINLLDELKITKCFLVGYSMGGRLGLYLTLNFPDRFFKVILESASPGLSTDAERLARIKSDHQIANKLSRINTPEDFTIFLNNWYAQPIFGNIKNHPEYPQMLASRLENQPLELVKSLRFMGTGYQSSLWDKLRDNEIPLLLVVGEYDEKFISMNTAMVYRCQLAKLRIIPHAGHNTHLEQTSEFVEQLRTFFRE